MIYIVFYIPLAETWCKFWGTGSAY